MRSFFSKLNNSICMTYQPRTKDCEVGYAVNTNLLIWAFSNFWEFFFFLSILLKNFNLKHYVTMLALSVQLVLL